MHDGTPLGPAVLAVGFGLAVAEGPARAEASVRADETGADTDTYLARHGLAFVMYENGTHVVVHGKVTNNDVLTVFFTAFNYAPQMGALYEELLSSWRAAGGTLFNASVDMAKPSKWGSWGVLCQLDDSPPRWDVLMRANATPPDWEDPPPPLSCTRFCAARARMPRGSAARQRPISSSAARAMTCSGGMAAMTGCTEVRAKIAQSCRARGPSKRSRGTARKGTCGDLRAQSQLARSKW